MERHAPVGNQIRLFLRKERKKKKKKKISRVNIPTLAYTPTMADAKKILLDLIKSSNNTCVDCRNPNPQWASGTYPLLSPLSPLLHSFSVTFAIFLCLQCAGVHRGFGVHIRYSPHPSRHHPISFPPASSDPSPWTPGSLINSNACRSASPSPSHSSPHIFLPARRKYSL